jgi:hypothetical protein
MYTDNKQYCSGQIYFSSEPWLSKVGLNELNSALSFASYVICDYSPQTPLGMPSVGLWL